MTPAAPTTSPLGAVPARRRARPTAAGLRALRAWSWLAIPVLGGALGYVLVSYGMLAVTAIAGLLVVLGAIHRPVFAVYLTIASALVANAVAISLLGLRMTLTDSLLWLSVVGTAVATFFAGRRLELSRPGAVLLAFSAWLFASALWADQPLVAVREAIQAFSFAMLFLVLENTVRTPAQLRRAVACLLAGGVVLLVGGLLGRSGFLVLPYVKIVAGGLFVAPTDIYFNPVVAACFLGVVSVICAAYLLGGIGSAAVRATLAAVLILSLVVQAMLFRRIELIGIVGASVLLVLFYGWRRWLLYAVTASALAALILLAVPFVREQFLQVRDMEEGTTKWHVAYLAGGWEIFKENPLLGGGAGVNEYRLAEAINEADVLPGRLRASEEKSYANHNIFMEVASESGLIGLALFGWFLVELLRRVWRGCGAGRARAPDVRHLCRGFLAAIALELVVAMAQNPQTWSAFWLVMAMGCRAAWIAEHSAPRPALPLRPGARAAALAAMRAGSPPREPAPSVVSRSGAWYLNPRLQRPAPDPGRHG